MNKRLESFRKALKSRQLDGAIIYSKENRRYLSGFTGSTGYLIISQDKAAFITDFRYIEQASNQCHGYEIIQNQANNLYDTIKATVGNYGIKRIGIEDGFMTVGFYEELKSRFLSIDVVSLKDTVENIRMIKDEEEIKQIEKAAELADAAITHILGYIKPGIREKDIELEMEYFVKKNGAASLSFEPIVASGVRSSLPHGIASDKIINTQEFLTIDFGCIYNGYCSDMTRTVFVGKATEEHKKIYNIVLEAQQNALKAIMPGVTGKEVDKVARDIIVNAGYGEYFGHGLGHGVGLAVHEEPRLSPAGDKILQTGMIVTDEPGIYIPNFGGVRIEDLILVTEDGCRSLTKSTRELIEL